MSKWVTGEGGPPSHRQHLTGKSQRGCTVVSLRNLYLTYDTCISSCAVFSREVGASRVQHHHTFLPACFLSTYTVLMPRCDLDFKRVGGRDGRGAGKTGDVLALRSVSSPLAHALESVGIPCVRGECRAVWFPPSFPRGCALFGRLHPGLIQRFSRTTQ